MNITMKSMVLFSCWLLGLTPVSLLSESVVMVWLISGDRPFSSRACRHGKLGSLLNRTGGLVVGLPAEAAWSSLLFSPFDGTANVFKPSLKPKVSPSLMLLSELCQWPNFRMHSSIRAGGAFLWGTLTRPQNNTSNLLAKVVDERILAGVTVAGAVDREAVPGSEQLLPLLGGTETSSLRSELFPACRSTLMISGTWKREENVGITRKILMNYFLRLKGRFSAHYSRRTAFASMKGTGTISGTLSSPDCGVFSTGSEHSELFFTLSLVHLISKECCCVRTFFF